MENLSRRIQRWEASPAVLNLMYIPALILFGLFIVYPLTQGVKYSFTDWNGYSAHYKWVGWEKYTRILTDAHASKTIINTLIYGLGATILQNILGMGYALILNGTSKWKAIARTIIYFPVITSPLIFGYLSYFLFQYNRGAFNDVLLLFGAERLDWLGNGPRAVFLITLVNTFQYVGIAMMIYLAGLQTVSKDCLDAAAIDGANDIQTFIYVTIPLIMPAITISFVLNLIGGMKLFDGIWALTMGGPGYASHSLSTMMYDTYFARQDAGFAAVLGNLMFVLITAISISSLVFLRRREVEQ